MMADQRVAGSTLAILAKDTPNHFSNVLCKLRQCHDLCVYSCVNIFGPELEGKIAQCSVDFRHASFQTAKLAERIGSNWCSTLVMLLEHAAKIRGNPSKLLTRLSTQAKEISEGFKMIGEWIRQLAGQFHDCQRLAGVDKKEYMKSIEDARKHAEQEKELAEVNRARAKRELESRKKSAGIWVICVTIPFVNIVAIPKYLIARDGVYDAQHSEIIAVKELAAARQELENAGSAFKKAEIAAKHVKELILALNQVEEICQDQAAFWELQKNSFDSFSVKVTTAKDFVEIGVDASITELVDWLKERRQEFATYHENMQAVINSFNFLSERRPKKFPSLSLPNLDLQLE